MLCTLSMLSPWRSPPTCLTVSTLFPTRPPPAPSWAGAPRCCLLPPPPLAAAAATPVSSSESQVSSPAATVQRSSLPLCQLVPPSLVSNCVPLPSQAPCLSRVPLPLPSTPLLLALQHCAASFDLHNRSLGPPTAHLAQMDDRTQAKQCNPAVNARLNVCTQGWFYVGSQLTTIGTQWPCCLRCMPTRIGCCCASDSADQ